jgi:hypothetical protein
MSSSTCGDFLRFLFYLLSHSIFQGSFFELKRIFLEVRPTSTLLIIEY